MSAVMDFEVADLSQQINISLSLTSTGMMSAGSNAILLQYMNANLRLKLALLCPSIRVIEKNVPLQIDVLRLDSGSFAVNGTTYQLGVYRQYHKQKVPMCIEEDNQKGLSCDLDEHGFPDFSADEIVTPGDLVVRDPSDKRKRVMNIDQRRIKGLESNLKFFQDYLDYKRGKRSEEPQLCQYSGFRRFRKMFHGWKSAGLVKNFVDYEKTKLAPFYCRRDGVKPCFTPLIKLTVQTKEGKIASQLLPYNVKLYEAQKDLAAVFFGERVYPIEVKHLVVGCGPTAIRMPLGLKVKVQELTVKEPLDLMFQSLESVIDPSCLPLKGFNKTAPKLSLKEIDIFDMLNPKSVLKRPNTKINTCSRTFHAEKQVDVIKEILEAGCFIGTWFSFTVFSKRPATEILEMVKRRIAGEQIGEESIVIPMSDLLELFITYRQNPHFGVTVHGKNYNVRMEVVAFGASRK